MIRTKDVTDIGTDPNAAVNFARNRVDLTGTGLDIADVRALLKEQLNRQKTRWWLAGAELTKDIARQQAARASPATIEALQAALADNQAWLPTDDSIAATLDSLDLRSVAPGVGLNILGLVIRNRYYDEHHFTAAQRACFEGFDMLDVPQVVSGYKPRPLEGVWATPPFLHNGSVPNLYELLSPAYERSKGFWLARREFDPVKVGYMTDRLSSSGGFWFDTRQPGNFNTGHEFRAGYVAYDEQHPRVQYGVIGPELSVQERFELIEYLKIHQDAAPPRSHPPTDCLAMLAGGQ